MKNKIQIITGNKGFVGSNLSKYLEQKLKNILGVSRNPTENEISYINLNKEKFDSAKSLIHLAGKAHDLKKTSNDHKYYEVNTELTKILFDQFLKSNCEVFIYMSSVKAAADVVDDVLHENDNPNPKTVYGKSKLVAEQYILSKEFPKDKRVYILRPCMIHGPNNKGNLNILHSFVARGIPYPFAKYQNERSFVSVENLCFVINELLDNKNIQSGIYNVADDDYLSTNQLVSIIGKTIQKKSKLWKVPKSIVTILAKIGDVIPLPINSEKLQKLTENYRVSNKKIKKAMQKDLPLTAEKGIEKTIASF